MSRAAIFLAGFGAGTAAALILVSPPQSTAHTPDSTAMTEQGSPAATLAREAAQLRAELEAEKKRMEMISSDMARLQKDLAAARDAGTKPAQVEATLPGSPAAAVVPALTPEQKAARIYEVKSKVGSLVEKKDGAGLVKLLQELRSLGVEAYPAIMEIAGIIDHDMWQGGREFNVKMQDYYTSFPPEIHAWALDAANAGVVPPGFKVHAAHGIMWSQNPEKDRLVLEAILRESDPEILKNMTDVLAHRPDEATGAKIIGRLQTDTSLNDEAFGALLRTAARMPGQAVDAYLEGALTTIPEGPRRDMLQTSLIRRNPPASGFMVDRVIPESQASGIGLKPGDIILSYGGVTLADKSIARAKEQIKGEGPFSIEVLRDGARIMMSVAPGQIGIDGSPVTKKE